MKVVKLLFVFAVIAGIVIAVIFVASGGDSYKTSGIHYGYYKQVEERINSEWSTDSVWSLEHFKLTQKHIDAHKKELGSGHATLCDHLHSLAIKRLHGNVIAEYAKPGCRKEAIDNFNTDLGGFLAVAPKMSINKRVEELRKLYDFYTDTRKFATKSFAKRPKFVKDNPDKDYSNEIDNYCNGERRKKEKYKENPLYRYICNINEIKRGMDAFEEKIAACRDNYVNNLSATIIKNFPLPAIPYSVAVSEIDSAKVKYQEVYADYRNLEKIVLKFTRQSFSIYTQESGRLDRHKAAFKDLRDGLNRKIEVAEDEKKRLEQLQNSNFQGYGML